MMASAELSTVSMMASAENELSTVPQNASEIQGIVISMHDMCSISICDISHTIKRRDIFTFSQTKQTRVPIPDTDGSEFRQQLAGVHVWYERPHQ